MPLPLPIDAVLPAVAAAARERRGAVVVAAPGAGKSTRVPVALLGAVLGEVLVLEPRRVAARLLAERVADELGERVGETAGYAMRLERAVGPSTRLCFLTEGVFVRRLARDPALRGVGAVVLDELHERHVDTDVALAAVAAMRRGARPDLVVLAMSATIDAGPVAALLDVPVLEAPGRPFPVEIRHAARASDEPLERQIARAVAEVVGERDGDVLVFLPGAAEIRRAIGACAAVAERRGLALVPLHGGLSRAEQDRALRPADRRKVVFATNVAETSITIEGVSIVVDAGLARVASLSSRGVSTVRVAPISQASAAQRAGRAGRTGPGLCVRLFTTGSLAARPATTAPEILSADLAPALLSLAAMGARAEELPWLDPPSPEGLRTARALLGRLGALGPGGEPSPVGRRMLELPLGPRVARVLLRAEELGVPDLGAWIAAALSEGSPLLASPATPTSSDVLDWADALERADGLRGLVDPAVVRAGQRVHAALSRGRRGPRPKEPEADLALAAREAAGRRAILAGFPDRVGRLSQGARGGAAGEREIVLAHGGSAKLARESNVQGELVVAVDLEQREQAIARAASAIEAEWLLLDRTDEVAETAELVVEASGRVVEVERLSFGSLTLEETRRAPRDPVAAARARASALLERSAELLRTDAVLALRGRLAFARAHAPDAGLPEPTDALFRDALAAAPPREGVPELAALVLDALDGRARAALDRLAPVEVSLPSGRRVRVSYPADAPPSIASRMQDFFGLVETPRVADGRVPLVLELLAPNQRPVQVTTDLAGFWSKHYPALARELRRRYPRHPFPDDPRSAKPPEPRRPR